MTLNSFDPFGWCEAVVSARTLHWIIRIAAMSFFAVFFVCRLFQYPLFLIKPLWAVETLIYAVFIIAYAVRTEPKDRAVGFMQIVIPIMGAALPFALLTSPPYPAVYQNPVLLKGIFWWMTLFTAFTLWGIWTLRRAFGITVEARILVTNGPYRWCRHPIYLGETLTAAGVTVWRFSWINVLIMGVFVALQVVRAKMEEAKMCQVFPAYRADPKQRRRD